MTQATASDLILHHYETSPFSEKVRILLGIKGPPWRSVLSPSIMPKPDLTPLTGGYRRTPQLESDIEQSTFKFLNHLRLPDPGSGFLRHTDSAPSNVCCCAPLCRASRAARNALDCAARGTAADRVCISCSRRLLLGRRRRLRLVLVRCVALRRLFGTASLGTDALCRRDRLGCRMARRKSAD